jgi:septum formation protein
MIHTTTPIILASKSPRRKKLLKQIGLEFKSKSFDVDEKYSQNENPVKLVKKLAQDKLRSAAKKINNSIIITADTIVVFDKKILGKPKDEKDAARMLKKLSGNKHYVYTGFAIFNGVTQKLIVDYEKTCVKFRTLSKEEIAGYVATGSPMDKAGAYGIQDDYGAVFVSKISGDYYNVVGLPLSKFYLRLTEVI